MTAYTGVPLSTLPMFRYGALIADPPWQFETRSEKGQGKSPQRHYPTMPTDEIAALPVADLARKESVLMLWATWPMLKDALRVMAAWGFRYTSGGVWIKRTKHDKPHQGTGYILRSASEPFLLGVTGSPQWGSAQRNVIETFLDDPIVIHAPIRQHSRKPAEQYEVMDGLVERAWKLELFARNTAWKDADCWGNETEKFEEA